MMEGEHMRVYAQTMPGVEEIAWLEIRSRLATANFSEYLFAKEQNGIVIFDHQGSLAELLQLRTAEDVFLLALSLPKLSRSWRDLRVLADKVRKTPQLGQAVDSLFRYRPPKGQITFRVISRKYGKHQYRRKDLEQAVSKGIKERYPHWRSVRDAAMVEIWANALGSRLIVGLRLSDRTMRHRYRRAIELEASLRASVAAAMVYLTQPEPTDLFLDPVCGSGTLLLERQLFGSYRHILGGDIVTERAAAAWQNLALQRKDIHSKAINVCQWDGRRLPLVASTVDKVAANLPFGKQIGSGQEVRQMYPAFFGELERVLRPNGRAVILSSEYEQVKGAIRQRPGLEIQTGYSIAVLGQWGRIYVVTRRE
jgi:23S rRNA G2445 N2-methylase RlmL